MLCGAYVPHTVTIEGELPGGGRLSVACRVAAIVPWLVMKGMALADRLKERDAYDIYYAAHVYPGGPARLAEEVRPHFGRALVREGLGKIRAKFRTPEDAGIGAQLRPRVERATPVGQRIPRIAATMSCWVGMVARSSESL